MNIPEDLKYSKDHEWIKVDGEIAIVGITDFAQDQLSDIVYVDVDTVDEEIAKNEVFGSVEAVKTVSDLFMPISGTIEAFNDKLDDQPELINEDPFGEGWIVKIKFNNTEELKDLLDAEAYKTLTEEAS